MIVVDEAAEKRLAKTLEALRSDPGTSRCMALNLANRPQLRDRSVMLRASLLQVIEQTTLPQSSHVFLCEDGDIFILASFWPAKEARALMVKLAEILGVPADPELMELIELSLTMHPLLVRIEAKLEQQRLALEVIKQQEQAQRKAQKRQEILTKPTTMNADSIARQRTQREVPQLMMIEDDAFTCRLVENVVKKQYDMQTLVTADHALSTYARLAPDILFLDINLPDVTGHELLERIVALDPNAYVVMLSGNADRDNIMAAMQRGAKGFIAKPFTREKLFHYINQCPTLTKVKEGA
jgi:CheY-like chemotaxis protein